MITIKTPFVGITIIPIRPDTDLIQELHKEAIKARDQESEVDSILKAFGLTPYRSWELHVLGTQFINKSLNRPEPMKKENVKVLVSSQTEANVLKALLQMLKEPVDNDYFDYYQSEMYLIFSTGTDYADWIIVNKTHSKLPGKTKVEVKDLIILLTATEGKADSILSGKCAIQVNNEREFKLLMEHYEGKGFVSGSGNNSIQPKKYPVIVPFEQSFWVKPPIMAHGYTIILFADFAKEVGIKVPVFIMKSEDGVDLCEGDKYYVASKFEDWQLVSPDPLNVAHSACSHSLTNKAFSTKEAAESWIAKANRPKHKVVTLFTGMEAHVYAGEILIKDADRTITTFHPSDLEDMLHTYKSLQP